MGLAPPSPACITGYAIAFVYNWRIALLITGAGPLVALGGFLHMKLVFGHDTGTDKIYSGANAAVTEAVSSIRVIHVSPAGQLRAMWQFILCLQPRAM